MFASAPHVIDHILDLFVGRSSAGEEASDELLMNLSAYDVHFFRNLLSRRTRDRHLSRIWTLRWRQVTDNPCRISLRCSCYM
ncbi:hypothetical protein F2Q69_00025160 [Brassica cretica]|uniref:Uncharacterized protein n=1 Tax=Brassica cretica TaxID=69181 RepID=A0A8S9Q8B9_BRACR|nr:hypothetical protein F2Q69_00025160 [Brassica cretica]